MFWTRHHVKTGKLMRYEKNNNAPYHHAAHYIDKVIKSAKPVALRLCPATGQSLACRLSERETGKRTKPDLKPYCHDEAVAWPLGASLMRD